ncbi:MAG TPA: AI-2E family transporter [Bacillota bacterium]|nr:AI-2E family transporter [Bacillota bacterium]HOA15514.1 AI-2E family transporter [Bacillota bacterium]
MDKRTFRGYLLLAFYIFLMGAALVKLDAILSIAAKSFRVMSPLFIGIAIAFILDGLFETIRKGLRRVFASTRAEKAVRFASVLIAHLFFMLTVFAIFYYMVPQFIESTKQFSSNYAAYRGHVLDFVAKAAEYLEIQSFDFSQLDEFIRQLPERITALLGSIFPRVFTITTSVISSMVRIVLGFVLSIYILSDKSRIESQLRRFVAAYFPRSAGRIGHIASVTSVTFKKFIYGQLTEALILAVLCFFGMLAFGFPYALPISMLIGVSNLVPIVGPIIGTIPGFFILLMVDPVKSLWFVLFIVVLQQIEGNLIYPRVMGQTIGLPQLWLLLTVILAGGIFGVLGLVIGVPTVTVLYRLIGQDVRSRLGGDVK